MSALLSFAGWSFVPNLASGFLHNGLSQLFPASMAAPGTVRYARDRRIIYVVVVLSYLAYTLYSAFLSIEPNYYNYLLVPIDVEEKQLRRAFRRVSTLHHPDKGGDEALFTSLRAMYDTLSNPITRFAYDRFGPQASTWPRATLLSDQLYRGLMSSVPFYVGSAFFISVLGYVQNSQAIYWRMFTLLTLACVNFMIVTSSRILPICRILLPRMVQFQQTSLLQSVCVTILIAISQVGPMLFPPQQNSLSNEAVLTDMAVLAKLCNAEASQALQMNHLPFPRGNTKTAELYQKTAEWMVQARIDQDPEVAAVRQQLLNPANSHG
ncbi:protein of unknown function [Taphrina deformans PYCC 5710]|uniref:J domain-containing protein n=1 Tax=Taphrina deformans (strain PYCC 5710 / ATCC 11124 / CBS 356.35 / IMI 108563 / JCM 9778 / NBRC 8474) TaxID=1097556 RepID=R4XKP0_TAPDE|nr:protein of unknown function [Taphrina deformans PYCC 5710]|eukprot:CCG83884.1 protein of unknown function [Taphrina deformans PYCC 5710]